MPLLARKKLILAKTETTYGTDSTPTGAANAILTRNLSITPLSGETVGRNTDNANLGNELQIQVGQYVEITFEVEIAGAGAAGTAPKYGPLLTACAFTETINASVSTVYAPTSTAANFKSMTIYFHHDGQKHALTGARGSFSLALTPGTIPAFSFRFIGLYNNPSSTADPSPTLTGFQTPLAVNKANTPTFSIQATTPTLYSLSIDLANEVIYRNVVGSESVEMVDRAPTGNVVIEAPTIATKNWFSTALASTTGAMQLIHGTTAGNIVQFDAPAVQVFQPRYGENNGVSTLEMGMAFVPSAGNDELTITVK